MRLPDPGPPPIPFSRPYFDRSDLHKLTEPLRCGQLTGGRQVARFEEMVAEMVGAREAVAFCSRAAALRLALLAAGAGPGREVLLSAFGDPAAADAAENCGAKAVFCDIDPATLALDPAEVRRRVGPLTVVVVAQHPFGLAADMDALLDICRARRVPLIEDCAAALGGRHPRGALGSLGLAGCLGFGAHSCLTTGGGGMVVTNDPALAKILRLLRGEASSEHDGPFPPEPVLPAHGVCLSELQGALGVAQAEKMVEIIAERRQVVLRYDELLHPLWWLRPPSLPAGCSAGSGPYVRLLEVEGQDAAQVEEAGRLRDRLLAELNHSGIQCRQPGRCLPGLPYYRKRYGLRPEGYPHALGAAGSNLALPLYVGMSEPEQERVVRELAAARERALNERRQPPEAAPGAPELTPVT